MVVRNFINIIEGRTEIAVINVLIEVILAVLTGVVMMQEWCKGEHDLVDVKTDVGHDWWRHKPTPFLRHLYHKYDSCTYSVVAAIMIKSPIEIRGVMYIDSNDQDWHNYDVNVYDGHKDGFVMFS